SVLLGPGEYLFGRSSHCDFRLSAKTVSRKHCLLRVAEDSAWVEDLQSHNGTYINDVCVEGKHSLAHGDWLAIGNNVFRVHLESLPPADSLAVANAEAAAAVDSLLIAINPRGAG